MLGIVGGTGISAAEPAASAAEPAAPAEPVVGRSSWSRCGLGGLAVAGAGVARRRRRDRGRRRPEPGLAGVDAGIWCDGRIGAGGSAGGIGGGGTGRIRRRPIRDGPGRADDGGVGHRSAPPGHVARGSHVARVNHVPRASLVQPHRRPVFPHARTRQTQNVTAESRQRPGSLNARLRHHCNLECRAVALAFAHCHGPWPGHTFHLPRRITATEKGRSPPHAHTNFAVVTAATAVAFGLTASAARAPARRPGAAARLSGAYRPVISAAHR